MRFFVLPASLLFAVAVHAAPQQEKTDDELARMLADKGLIGQLKQVRQTVTERTSDLVVTAIGFLGVPYRRGGNTAESGFDCSGFVRAMYNQTVGHMLPRRAEEQAAATEKIDRDQLKPGDLVFFNTMRRAFSHVGIYVGEGKFIHSPRSGAQVRVEDMNGSYWQRRFDGARRVVGGPADEVKAAAVANTGN
ncbi:C40 family peptidase [Variovorax sp. NFACC27]|uniref:Peptidoglycan endopeptidase n=1 Tax=Variovorax gossypii TaxID=1679495 RepID=A0A431TT11_9BURK|nr:MULTISPECIES: C40 family peptidase [Variovorax]MDP9600446.1 cell wall-associated NlpC family hydrolase [Variovorax paradoxus]SEF29913.1 NlpC/P60 family protein [Variovorax sp. NFACC28]SEG85351.1 NlpC/P60 family protein [Variovorax sp. NFACC29]SFD20417.1 NlpC/P60 family protein [Variovorax sp. NFACC26]SFG27568.1 NlpC/P60 family protein [Variovorax sp. NFACC27]